MSQDERFWSKVEPPLGIGECWEWQACKQRKGYGQFSINRKLVYAHRYAYESLIGKIPSTLLIDHLCRNRGCVNPHHMEPVTPHENVLRGLAGVNEIIKTHCPRGHPLSGDNLIEWHLKRGRRACKACHLISARLYAKRHDD